MQREKLLHSRIRGLTLVELIVTLAIFGMVTTVLLSSFLTIFSVREQTNVVQQANDDVRVILDGIEREIQTGNNIIASEDAISFVVSARADQPPYPVRYRKTAAGTIEKAVGKNVAGDPCAYNATTMAFTNVNACWLPVTGSNVQINTLSFSVVEAETGDAQTSPLVTVGLAGTVRDSAGNATPLTYSTSIMPRNRITVSDVTPSPGAGAPITSFIDVQPASPAGCRISNQYYLPIDPVPPPPGGWPALYTDCDSVDLAFRVTMPGAAGFHSLRYSGPNAAVTFGSGETGNVDISFTGPKALMVPMGTSTVTVVAEDLYGQTRNETFLIEGVVFTDPPLATECSDGVDNDGDGFTDYPNDPGCTDANDDDETNVACIPDGANVFTTHGCGASAALYETSPEGQCCNGFAIFNCPSNFATPVEDVTGVCGSTIPQCGDGADNDGDGLTDFPADPGCVSAIDNDETNTAANQPPTANAGADRTITLPTTSAAASGATDSDTDGSITGRAWSFVSGPGPTPTITNGTTRTPSFSGMSTAGVYTFRYTVTDDDDATASDTMVVTVLLSTPTGLTATAGACGTNLITVTWNPVAGATSYEVRDGATSLGTVGGTSFPYVAGAPGSSHTFTVRALNGVGGYSVYSGGVTRNTPGTCAPTPVVHAGAYLDTDACDMFQDTAVSAGYLCSKFERSIVMSVGNVRTPSACNATDEEDRWFFPAGTKTFSWGGVCAGETGNACIYEAPTQTGNISVPVTVTDIASGVPTDYTISVQWEQWELAQWISDSWWCPPAD